MDARSRILKGGLSALLCLCMVMGNFGGLATALAQYDGNGNATIYNVNQDSDNLGPDGRPMKSRPMTQVDLLVGTNAGNPLRGSTLDETIHNYRDTYLLDVAADFCVFLQGDFIVYDSDAEGRVAVGGNIVLNNKGSGDGSYAIGTGDYANVTELEKLIRDRTGAATVIIGGELTTTDCDKSQLSDIYYVSNATGTERHKYEGNDATQGKETPDRKSNKKLVLNSNDYVTIPKWAVSHEDADKRSIMPESPRDKNGNRDWNWFKIDQSQTYMTQIIDFDAQFKALSSYSRWLVDSNPQSQNEVSITFSQMKAGVDNAFDSLPDGFVDKGKKWNWDNKSWQHWWGDGQNGNTTNIVTFRYTGDSSDKRECVYFNLTQEQFEQFRDCPIIAFENIPLLPDGPRQIIDNNGITTREWPYAYVVINVPNGGEVHVSRADNEHYSGQKYTVFNGEMISRDSPGDDRDDEKRNNHPGVSGILYNFPNASTVVLSNNFQGTVFAPNAHVTDEEFLARQSNSYQYYHAHGHLSGAIIAKSFTGYTEFGYRPFSGMAIVLSGLLEVKKTVVGGADPDAEFRFRVTLEDKSINEIYGDMEFKNGVAEFTLKAGEKAVAKGLKDGTKYRVEEIDSGNYKVGVIGDDGSTVETNFWEGAIYTDEKSTVEFVNTYIDDDDSGNGNNSGNGDDSDNEDESGNTVDNAPKTGDTFSPALWLGLMAISLMGIGISSRAMRREKARR